METHTDNTLQATSNQLAAIQLSPHFTLGEMLTLDRHPDNLPSLQAVVSLAYGCQLILEPVRQEVGPIIINSGFRSPEVNKAVGGWAQSNHLHGCAVDIRCMNLEQAFRYASLLLDISDITHEDFDELIIERSRLGNYWIHFAVRPSGNRRRTNYKR
jgi:hypothetical protein